MRLCLLSIAFVASCGSTPAVPPTTPSASPDRTATPSPARPSASASPTATPDSPPESAFPMGSLVVTVSDRLRVRSEPRVSDDSVKYEPLLPLGTKLRVVGGPVTASGFVWWQVEPITVTLTGASRGWAAMADPNGEPWLALAEAPIQGLAVALGKSARLPASQPAARAAAGSIAAFGIDHYRRLLADPARASRNLVFSPTSVALALGMVRAGARGDTATEMDRVLHVSGWNELAAGLNSLDQALARRDATWSEYDRSMTLALKIANASFAQRGWTIEQPFLDAIGSVLGSGLHLVDYEADPEAARRAINGWVSDRTEERIPELLAPPNVSTRTRLYLVNAIYLKAEWESWFELDLTEAAPFNRLDGGRVDVPTMHRTSGPLGPMIPYARGAGWQAVELRYLAPPGSPPLAMMFVLPDDLASFEAALGPDVLASVGDSLDAERLRFADPQCPPLEGESGNWCYPYDLSLYLPRFSIDTRAALNATLAAAGMQRAFDPAAADFSAIHEPTSGGDRLFVSAVIHQANIDVDEKGTEAAAATAAGMDTGGGPAPLDQITIRFDRPFLFFLRDVETGAVLFMGRVVDPSSTR